MTVAIIVFIAIAGLAAALFYRTQARNLRRSLAIAVSSDADTSLNQGEALQSILLLKRRLHSYEYNARPKRKPLPPIADSFQLSSNSPQELVESYFRSIAEELCAINPHASPCLVLRSGTGARVTTIVKSEPLLEAVLQSVINVTEKRYMPVTSCFERFGLEESICVFFETKEGIHGALWIGFIEGYRPLATEVEEWRELVQEFADRVQEKVALDSKYQKKDQSNLNDTFLAHVSHDIRSPLNNIRSILHLFQLEGINKDGEDLLSIALKNCDVMSEIVETVLDYSAQQSDRVTNRPESVPVEQIVSEVVQAFTLSSKVKKLTLTFEGSSSLHFYVDKRHLRRILSNLVSNAIKYTSSGTIHIAFENKGERSGTLSVSDTGIGLTQHQINKLFEPFSRFQPGLAEGAGLGLVVTKSLTEVNGGRISVDSQYGVGTTFTLEFPATSASITEVEQLNKPVSSRKNIKVLIADDDRDWRLSLTRSLEARGYEVYGASSASEALGIMKVAQIDAVITDRHMPGRGEEVINYTKSLGGSVQTMLVSGESQMGSEILPRWCTFKLKPVDPSEIIIWLEGVVPEIELRNVA